MHERESLTTVEGVSVEFETNQTTKQQQDLSSNQEPILSYARAAPGQAVRAERVAVPGEKGCALCPKCWNLPLGSAPCC